MTLLEKLADFDEGIMEKYLEDTSVSATEIYSALRKATLGLAYCAGSLRECI